MTPAAAAPGRLNGRRILVVEDTLLVAELIAENLAEWGCIVIGPAARVAQALRLVAAEPLDGALLDVNLSGETVFPVADALLARGTPFVLVTGYGDAGAPARFHAAPRLTKPFETPEMARLMAAHFGAPPPV